MDNTPIPNRFSLEEDARNATSLMKWQKELDARVRKQELHGKLHQLDKIDYTLISNCEKDIVNATECSVLQVFTYENGQLCLTI